MFWGNGENSVISKLGLGMACGAERSCIIWFSAYTRFLGTQSNAHPSLEMTSQIELALDT